MISFPCDTDDAACRIRSLWHQLGDHLTLKIALDPRRHIRFVIAMSSDELIHIAHDEFPNELPLGTDAFYSWKRLIAIDASRFGPRSRDSTILSTLAHEIHHAIKLQSLHLSLVSRISMGCHEHHDDIESLIRSWDWGDQEENIISSFADHSRAPEEVEAICFSRAIAPIPDDRLSQIVRNILAPIDLQMEIPR